ncbi:ApbE family lipoprotein [Pseudonocardia dioxanivorans CB1190]|uniref:FAD:protein FMN transferase n=1 Tax=Pseudonocardia dioxanivorans (strain ATCC 55486 / DSM 44775 / JCM 13855 / CB1190) TaxID=675635 RepID=F4CM93_PSEUX|nr:FAD:protein FMN transferase [Pseudonocardia dioxanivorans]AEA23006.1 ApbE family lipoprotein [Pseudonocardia dioxanivorans CB1190]GJF01558.1 FAD:protein FMN transferase [Pseudonocardia sp. D17]
MTATVVGPEVSESFPAIGTTATVVVTDGAALRTAVAMLRAELDELDRSCSRFRVDSEIRGVERRAGTAVPVGDTLALHLDAALRAASLTDGLLDPTVGTCMDALGYDRDIADVADSDTAAAPVPAPGWWRVGWNVTDRTVLVPRGTGIDLGSTAKALAADRSAAAIADRTGCGVLVSLGGDVAVAGPPPATGWRIRIGEDHAARGPGPVVAIASGGLATSGTTRRRWRRGDLRCHHIVDPRTGLPTAGGWRTVSVAARTCLEANTAATAAIVAGHEGCHWLSQANLPARLVADDGQLVVLGGWPADLDAR